MKPCGRSTANGTRLEPARKRAATNASGGPPVSDSVSAPALAEALPVAEALAEALAEPPLTVTVPTMPISLRGPQKYS